jgi:hypothetical protein
MNNVDVDIRSVIEDQIIQRLKDHAETNEFDISVFYGAFSPELFVEFVHSKIQAGRPCVFVRCGSQDSKGQLDTMGTLHNTVANVEVVVASNIVREKEFPHIRRYTNVMLKKTKTALSAENDFHVTIDNTGDFNLVWRRDESLFRIEALNVDAQKVNYELQGLVYEL